jgi:flavin-binding protein dodecin
VLEKEREMNMAVVKVIEIIAESDESWEAAAQDAVNEAAKTVDNINQVYIDYFKGIVENNKIVRYSVNAKISFVVKN